MADDKDKKPADKPAEEKKKDSTSGMIGEIVAAAGAAIGGVLLAAFARTKGITLSEIEADFAGFVEDVDFGLKHWGVVLARRIVWFWRICLWLMLAHLIVDGYLTNGLFLGTGKSIFFYLVFELAHAGLQLYAWPVKPVGAFTHRKWRLPVDEARRKVKRLEHLQETKDATFDVADLFAAQADLAAKETVYNEQVEKQGANNRSPSLVIGLGLLISLFGGFALLYGVIGRHDGGPYSYDQVVGYVEDVCILPFPLFVLPLAITILVSPFLFNRVGSLEDLLTFLKLSVKAGATIGKGLPEIEKEHNTIAYLNGDQPFRNATLVAKQHWMELLATIGIKVMSAIALLVHHCLFYPSWTAFKLSTYVATFAFFLRVYKEKWNVLREHQLAVDRIQKVSFVIIALIYVHFWFAGGAPYEARGLGWWISDYGPFGTMFGSDSQHTANAVSAGADAVAQPTVNYGSHFLGMSGTGVAVFFVLVVIIGAALVAIWKPIFNLIKGEDKSPAVVKKIATYGFVAFGAFASIPLVAYIFRAPLHVEQSADVVRTTTRPAATQTMPSAPGASTAFDSDTRRRCAFNALNQPPCEPTCYQFHGWSDSRVNIEAGARNGTCYVVPWYSVGNSASR